MERACAEAVPKEAPKCRLSFAGRATRRTMCGPVVSRALSGTMTTSRYEDEISAPVQPRESGQHTEHAVARRARTTSGNPPVGGAYVRVA